MFCLFNDTATTEIYTYCHTLSLHDALPISRVDLKALPAAIGSKRVSFGKAEDMERLLGISPGSVTPLAALNAAPGSITVVVDKALAAAGTVNVHTIRNTETIGLSRATNHYLLSQLWPRPPAAPHPVPRHTQP